MLHENRGRCRVICFRKCTKCGRELSRETGFDDLNPQISMDMQRNAWSQAATHLISLRLIDLVPLENHHCQ